MPDPAIHYAAGALVVHLVGLRGRDRALVALFAVAPDLDVITAIPWALLAPHLPLSADWLITGAHLFGHRGITHTLLSVPLVAGAIWWWRRDLLWTLAGAGAWLSEIVLDTASQWATWPLWPFSDAQWHTPLVAGSDLVLTPLSILVALALLAPVILGRVGWPGQAHRQRWTARAEAHQDRLLAAVAVVLVLVLSVVPVTAAVTGAPVSQLHPDGFPTSVQVEETPTTWVLTSRWHPWDAGEVEEVARVDDRTNGTAPASYVTEAACTLPGIRVYAPVDQPAWTMRRAGDRVLVTAVDVVRNATGEGGPSVTFTFQNGAMVAAALGAGPGTERTFQVAVPPPVLEAARCR